MNKILLGLLLLAFSNSFGQKNQTVTTEDVPNFWKAYDQIVKTKDSLKQIEIIQTQYIDKGTEGLKGMMQARRYTPSEYIFAINHYHLFWNSVRQNTFNANAYAKEIEKGIAGLKKIYSYLKPAKIYFTIGALRSNGTTIKDKVLIGSELAMADRKVVTNEIEKKFPNLPPYFKTNPVNDLTFLNVHEYIHTQQKTTIGITLLAQTVLEGVAEFIATIALHTNSPNQQISFGKLNDEKIKKAYVKEIFSTNFDNWLWNSPENEFKMRDLAYYVGYAICEKYYQLSDDKNLAIKTMIELDYNNEVELRKFVETTQYFEKPLATYKEEFENSRPFIVRIEQLENGNQDINPNIKKITLFFSQSMNKKLADFDIGPLGDKNAMWLEKRIGFSDDGQSYSFEIKSLEPEKRYQLLVTDTFLNISGIPLKPYLIDFRTSR